MNEAPQLLKPSRHFSGQSPTRNRLGDDILANLSPATAVGILSEPAGALKACIDAASVAEQDFATRTALASRTIWEWVEELGDWNWPTESGPAGFETPNGKQRKLSIQITRPEGEDEDTYLGSLTAQDVARYEARVDQIRCALDDLAVEEIKSHVLTNHIWPLSRPSTPMSDSNQSRLSTASSYNKMEDLTAVITAIVVQTLPNLARLSRLLQVWSTRLRVLRQVPGLLLAIEDAEMAIKSGWNAISQRSRPRQNGKIMGSGDDADEPTLSRDGFNVMKLILEKKVSNTGRSLDYMLDSLEGLPDTLPNSWLDRMEAVERDYGDWVAACERILREDEWARTNQSRRQERSPSRQKKASEEKSTRRTGTLPVIDTDCAVKLPVPKSRTNLEEPSKQKRDITDIPTTPTPAGAKAVKQSNEEPPQVSGSQKSVVHSQRKGSAERVQSVYDGTQDDIGSSPPRTPSPEAADRSGQTEAADWDDSDYIVDREPALVPDEEHLELPPLTNGARRGSNTSEATTVLHGASSHFDGMSSDLPEVSASPAIARSRVREAEYVEVSPVSPPSSPPLDAASSSFTAPDSPWIPPIREEDETLSVDGSYLDDYDDTLSVSEITGPISRRESTSDQQLRQQISEIIEGIPAKIRLSSEPPKVNLNPPDLQLPRLRKMPSREPFKRSGSSLSSHDPYKRSNSSMSSRAGTPSFTLSPAKNVRVRHQRSQQEIKVYHLSRSTGEAPIKLFIRCVGEHGERVMVRVGGGWADLSEYLKEYASHHGRRSAGADKAKVEVRDVPRVPSGAASNIGSSPSSRPASALEQSPSTPLAVRKTRRSVGAASSSDVPRLQPKTPAVAKRATDTAPSSEDSTHSRPSSRLSWVEDDSSFLGLAGPTGKKVEMSAENKAWVESVKQKVRLASGERKVSGTEDRNRFGELGKVGGTKRLFPKAEDRRDMKR